MDGWDGSDGNQKCPSIFFIIYGYIDYVYTYGKRYNVRRCNRLFALKKPDLVQFRFFKGLHSRVFLSVFLRIWPNILDFLGFLPIIVRWFLRHNSNFALFWSYFLLNLIFLAIIVGWFWHVGRFRVRFLFFQGLHIMVFLGFFWEFNPKCCIFWDFCPNLTHHSGFSEIFARHCRVNFETKLQILHFFHLIGWFWIFFGKS